MFVNMTTSIMAHVKLYMIILLCLVMKSNCQTKPGLGKVFIGNSVNSTDTTYSFSFNDKNGQLPVYLVLYNETTDEDIGAFESQVRVTCEFTPKYQGYSDVTFGTKNVSYVNPGPVKDDIAFVMKTAGRVTSVTCYGQSTSSGSLLPQFTKERSRSDPIDFEIRSSGTVNLCDQVVLVPIPTKGSSSTEGKFLVALSEVVEDNEVVVNCLVTDIPGGLRVDISPQNISIGNDKETFTFQVIAAGEPVTVNCSAQSRNNGRQFQTDSSVGTSTIFKMDDGKVSLLPLTQRTRETKLKAYLVLGQKPTSQLTFECIATVANTTQQALEIRDNPNCETVKATQPPAISTTPVNINSTGTESTNSTSPETSAVSTTTTPSSLISTSLDHNSLSTTTTEMPSVSTTQDKTTSEQIHILETMSHNPVFSDVVTATTLSASSDVDNATYVLDDYSNLTSYNNASGTTPTTTTTTTTTSTTPSTTTTARPANESAPQGEWVVTTSPIIMDTTEIFRLVEVERISPVENADVELVVLTCCAPDGNNDDVNYSNKSAGSFAVAYIEPPISINWTDATPDSEKNNETEIVNPGYVEVGPCPCDLTKDACNTDCCCDPDCSSVENATFTCIPGRAGGYPYDATPRRLCSTGDYPGRPDWGSMLCVEKENSAFLGYFNNPESLLRTISSYKTSTEIFRSTYSFDEKDKRNPVEDIRGSGYKQGISVKTGQEDNDVDGTLRIGDNYRLALPQRTGNGDCITTAPVRYLQDYNSECVYQIKENLCSENSILSSKIYVEPKGLSQPPCPKSPVVLSQHGDDIIADTDVHYLCTDEPEEYLKSIQKAKDIFTATTEYLFGVDFDNETVCDFDLETGAYVCENVTSTVTAPNLPSRCSWDDGFTRAPTPELIDSICQNAVLDVFYNFTWRGAEILHLNATIVLGNVPLTQEKNDTTTVAYTEIVNGTSVVKEDVTAVNLTYPTVISQNFKIKFVHDMETAENTTDSNDTTHNPRAGENYERSGNPGYDVGKFVLSGLAIRNETTDEILYVDFNETNSLSLWKTGSAGLCTDSERQTATFGEDTISSCILRMSLEQFEDCETLRKLILNRQDSLMPSKYVSQVGDPNHFDLEYDWVEIFREDISFILSGNDTEPDEITNTTSVSNDTSSNGTRVKDSLDGRCRNVPAGIHLDIMYAEAGLSNWIPIYNIVGAKISYKLATWQLKCVGLNNEACWSEMLRNKSLDGSYAVQTFTVSSSTSFIQVPAKKPEPKTKYEEENKETVPVCSQDACWEEIFYPFIHPVGGDSISYTVPFGLSAVVGVVGLFMVTRPWW